MYREGDGSSTYGFGYIYNFRLNGPEFKFGESGIMGDSPVTIDVVGQGSEDGCKDFTLSGTAAATITSDKTSSADLYGKLWTLTTGTTAGYIKEGDRLTIPSDAKRSGLRVVSVDSTTTLWINPL